jgi:hypothetical protein
VAVRRQRMGQGSVALSGIHPELDAKGQLIGRESPYERGLAERGALSLARILRRDYGPASWMSVTVSRWFPAVKTANRYGIW